MTTPATHAHRVLLITLVLCLPALTVLAQNEKVAATQDGLVKLNVLVADRDGKALDDVRKEDLQVIDAGVSQPIAHFARDERPVICGFVIDASGSVRRILNQLIDATKTAAGGLRDGDEGFVARFVDRDNFKILQEMTSDRESIDDAVDDIYVEGGQTAVHDAVDKALKYLEENQSGGPGARRRILVLVSDGEDRASRMKDSKALLARLRETDVQVFVLGLTKFSSLQSSAGKAMDLLNSVADESGGLAYFPEHAGALTEPAQEIARALHTQYTIGYAGKSAGGNRTATVRWVGNDKPKRRVIVRPSVK